MTSSPQSLLADYCQFNSGIPSRHFIKLQSLAKTLFKLRFTVWRHLWNGRISCIIHFPSTFGTSPQPFSGLYIADLSVMSVHSKTIFSYIHVTSQSIHDLSSHNLCNSSHLHKPSLFHLYGDERFQVWQTVVIQEIRVALESHYTLEWYGTLVQYCTLKHNCGTVVLWDMHITF